MALVLLALYAALPALSGLPALRGWIAKRVEAATASEIRFDSLRINYDFSVTLSAISVADPGRAPFLTADRLHVSVRPLGLFSGQALRVRVEGPHLHMAELPAGAAQSGGAPPLSLEHAEVVDLFVHPLAGEGAAAIGPLSLSLDAARGAPGQLSLSGRGPLPGDAGTVSWSAEIGATLETSYGSLTVDATAPLDAMRPWVALELPPAVSPTAASLQIAWRGTAEGRVAVELETGVQLPIAADPVRLTGSGEVDPAAGSAQLKLSGAPLALRSDDATRVANGIETRLELTARRGDAGSRLDFRLDVPRGEVLWDRFYVDLRRHPLVLRGQLDAAPVELTLTHGGVSVGGIGTIAVSGSYDMTHQRERWRAEFKLPGLAAAYDVAIREPLQAEFPLLGRVELSGTASGVIEQDRLASGERHVGGVIDLANVGVKTSDPSIVVAALDAHLPFDLSQAASGSSAVQSGQLRVRGLRVADVDVGDVALPLRVERNQFAISEPVRIPLLGGGLEVAHLRAVNLTTEPQASLGVAVHDVDLAETARALHWPPLSGRAVGEIPNLTIDRRAVLSEGEIRLDVFGGSARMRNLRVEEPFSTVPTLRLDLDFADILLAEVTRTFEVGRISGVIAGGVRDLEIANGQAARFDAWMETVERPGVPQRISVTAIRQLSILGGSGGDPISFGVLSFFDEYRYAKMGFRCRLENDRFTVEGVEERDGAQYLVVGTTLPPRVNVISHTRVISFSELVQRLSRVLALTETGADKPDATEAPAPPPE